MPKLPRDLSGRALAQKLQKYGYKITRETGSHIRITSKYMGYTHHMTIPDHKNLKISTLNNILKSVSEYLNIEKSKLIKEIFS